MIENQNLKTLFQRYIENQCTAEEIALLFQLFGKQENEDQLREMIRKQLAQPEITTGMELEREKVLLKEAFIQIQNKIKEEESGAIEVTIPYYKQTWFRASAAAVVVVLLSVSAFLFLQNSDQPTLIADTKRAVQIEDISPGVNNAILTLDDGSTIILDSVNNGSLATQGNSNIVKTGNQISYMLGGSENISIEPVYNTISTANSNQYQLTLSDGTRVWLNAASSIRFPSSFIGKERKVEVSGEVYFEVAKSNEQKFKVAILNGNGSPGEIEVLGTHFNINAYNNEPDIKTTLLEGSLRVNSGKVNRILLPGQQALQDESGIQVKQNVNLEQVVAWKNGYFLFNNTDLKTLMRQVSRWYNVEVVFEGTTHPDGFSGKVGRDVPLSNLIKALELNDVKIQRVGRNLIVKP